MATADLATELMESLTPIAYSKRITALINETAMSSKTLQTLKTNFKGMYEFSSDVFRARNGTPKPTGMLELFGKYSGEEPNDIRKDMIKYVDKYKEEIGEICKDALTYKSLSLRAWISKMRLRKSVCDEIALYVLCKLYSRHALIYTTKGYWSTIGESELTGLTGLEIEKKCDLSMIYTEKGLVLCTAVKEPGDEKDTDKLKSNGKTIINKTERRTKSIQGLLKEKQDKEKEKSNKVSAKLSVEHILPDSDRMHNTRLTTPLRRRQNFREKRPSCTNKNYSDNLDTHHLDSSPTKRSRRRNIPKTLREPSSTRITAQMMITRGELQRSVSPDYTCKLIGTVIKDEKETKHKVKVEEDLSRNTRRSNRSWPTEARLVHVDRTPCSEECMKNHPDDDEPPPTVNKNIKETYGSTNKELQAVPATSTIKETKTTKQLNPDSITVNNSEQTNQEELCGVPDSTATETQTSANQENSNTVEAELKTHDDPTITDDVALPKISTSKENTPGDTNIDLQEDLNAETVTQPNTEVLEELSEFSNILNLDDVLLNVELPIMGTTTPVERNVDPAMDLEIAMENARFLDANPLPGQSSTSSSVPVRSQKNYQSSTCHPRTTAKSGTADNTHTKDTRTQSPRGTV